MIPEKKFDIEKENGKGNKYENVIDLLFWFDDLVAAPVLKLVIAPGLRSWDDGFTDNKGFDFEPEVSGTLTKMPQITFELLQ